MDFTDRHVLVTGGTGTLGTAVLALLIEAGAHCHVPVRNGRAPRNPALAGHPRLTLVPSGDLADEQTVADLFATPPGLWASIHLAGTFAYAGIGATDLATLRRQMDANFVSCYLCCRAAVKTLAGTGEGGRIVNVAARPALEPRGGANMTAYTSSKAAVAALTAALAEEVVGDGILVNAVAPSIFDTPTNRDAMPEADMSRWPHPDDVAHTIAFLASSDNKVTRGAVVPVYGRS